MLTREQYFPGQAEEEQVALFIRRHWMAFLPWILMTPVVFTGGILLAVWSWISITPDNGSGVTNIEAQALIITGTAIFLLSLLFLYLRAWMSYYLDVTIVTERRLIDIEQEGIFGRSVAEQSLLRVQDVSARQNGFFHHFLNYGNLYVETAGEQPNFELHNLPRPNEVAKTIINLHDSLVETGGHEIDMAVAEGDVGRYTATGHRPKAHPLDELMPYFPEPSMAHPHPEPKKLTKSHDKKIVPHELGEGELHEGETINLDQHS